MQNSTE